MGAQTASVGRTHALRTHIAGMRVFRQRGWTNEHTRFLSDLFALVLSVSRQSWTFKIEGLLAGHYQFGNFALSGAAPFIRHEGVSPATPQALSNRNAREHPLLLLLFDVQFNLPGQSVVQFPSLAAN
jgi:hypothetical protein